ncbi:DUF262 [Shewanella sediminis HAW-EB3]|uniref:DUF262 n=1 Tax=Shewanella sediminis (strain HAW-EB3) TaxID=425104 RepID=A8FVK2_SHESH|nr:DUF262 domain-containing protein [Shewanella sediminis]ABV36875.1 DUF262 [Shewanella sediminis HAW-EB3]
MAYQTPITIRSAIENIKKRRYLLPSIQREFVWDTDQIETLFDSLMRDYPISTFLFWKVDKNKVKDFQFYEFLNNYHEKDNRHNRKAEPADDEDIIALLDGQQRMTSMFIALTGTYSKKMPYYQWNSPHAFPAKKLYLNLLKPSDGLEVEYDFKFLTEEDATQTHGHYWFECGKILELTDMGKVSMFMMKNKLMDTSFYTEKESEFAINTLSEFFKVIHDKGTISYYLEKSEELDKVLQIFIRINSGGTKLSYSDLLLSIATAQWKDKDAREVIHEFVDDINQIGDGFNFNKDIVLKSCLVLSDFDVKFKVDNFTKENMAQIELNWDKISAAVCSSIQLVSKLGFSRENLAATNTIIPIAYFIYRNGFENSILHSVQRFEDRIAVKDWLARVLLKGTFGGQPDSIYPKMRDLVNENLGKFPLQETINHYRGSSKSISFTEDDVDNLLSHQYGKAKTYCTLTLLYPSLNYNFKYHQDHVHPQSFFKKNQLKTNGLSDEQIEQFLATFNCLPNLQLLEATQNIEKSDKSFDEWLNLVHPTQPARESFLRQHHIISDTSLAFEDYLSFYEQRRNVLKLKLINLLNVSVSSSANVELV